MAASEPTASGEPPLSRFLEGGFELIGIEAGETELAVMSAVDAIYRPQFERLVEADLGGVEAEPDPDLSRSPADRP